MTREERDLKVAEETQVANECKRLYNALKICRNTAQKKFIAKQFDILADKLIARVRQ